MGIPYLQQTADELSGSPPRSVPRSWTTVAGCDVPTLAVALAVYGGYGLLTWFYRDMPPWIAAPLGALCLTWYGSLQHETIHDHPTPWRRVNSLLAGAPLALWIPYRLYRLSHLQHHRHGGRYLTDVGVDPESFYELPGTLATCGIARGMVHVAHCTLAGRLVLGPMLGMMRFWSSEWRLVFGGNRMHRKIWADHLVASLMVLFWITQVCHIPMTVYLMAMVYPGAALSHLRSFAEHRAAPEPLLRTVTVEANPLWALLFLNNNLHIAHHAQPTLSWHRLPGLWRGMRRHAVDSGLVIERGYAQVAARYLLRPVISAEHPGRSGEDH
jgi:fatty acid desaturase